MIHVDIFSIAETDVFKVKVFKGVFETLTVSKVELDKCWFMGLGVPNIGGQMDVFMEEYMISLDKILEILRASRDESLIRTEHK